MYKKRVKVIIRQKNLYDKTGDATKGVAKFDFTKTFRNQLFSRVRVSSIIDYIFTVNVFRSPKS